MSNFFQNPTHRAQIGYNSFPFSHNLKFSNTVGELLPVFYDLAKPGDKYSFDYHLKTRTMPLQAPAWCDLKERIDFFFVPMTQLYQFYGEFYYGIQDVKTSLQDISTLDMTAFPHLDVADVSAVLGTLFNQPDYYFPANRLSGSCVRVAELLGFPIPHDNPIDDPTVQYKSAPNVIFPAAYQKIFFDEYRDSDREMNDASFYNLDQYATNPAIPVADFAKFFTLRYARWKPDFFTHIFVSPLYGADSNKQGSAGFTSDIVKSLNQWLVGQQITTYKNLNVGDPVTMAEASRTNSAAPTAVSQWLTDYMPDAGSHLPGTASVVAALSPTSIRSTFAVQKLLEVTRRSGKHYDAQTLAHFGVNVPTGISGEVLKFGSDSSDLRIGDVISTAETQDAALGAQAGRGYGERVFGKRINFTAPCDGVIMAIYCCVPDVDYAANGMDRLNSFTTRSDFFTPEYDNLGMQPLFAYQSEYDFRNGNNNNAILGWQYRYSEYKAKYNRVCGSLKRTLKAWTPQRQRMTNSLSSFYVSPFYLDGIMDVDYGFNPVTDIVQPSAGTFVDNTYGRDPIHHQLYWNIHKASKMSTYGLESL